MEVVTLYEADITLSLGEVVETLKTDAGLLLKHQTDLTTIQSTLDAEYERLGYLNMVHHCGAFDPQRVLPAVKRSIVINETIRAVLFPILGSGCVIASYATMVAFADRKFETMGRDADWRFISNNEQHMGMICIHFGGDPNVHWKIDMERNGKEAQEIVTIEAEAGDIFICSLDVRRTMPRIASDGPEKAYYVIVSYVSDKWDISHRRPIAMTVAEQVCEEAGDQCSYVGDYLFWNGPLGR